MAVKTIITEPNKRLRQISKPVESVGKEEQQLMNDMLDTMYDANGIGLAATQVNHHIRLIVMDLSDNRDDPKIFINPTYKVLKGHNLHEFEEGCLSIPGFNETIARPDKIELVWQDINGKEHTDTPEGLLTVCIQHEIDHLEGKLMVDYISALKRDRVRNKLLKEYSRT